MFHEILIFSFDNSNINIKGRNRNVKIKKNFFIFEKNNLRQKGG